MSDTAMAKVCRCSRQTIYEWKQNPAFLAWFDAAMLVESQMHWRQAIYKHELLAIGGSVKSFAVLAQLKTVGQRGGGFTGTQEIDESTGTTIVNNYAVNAVVKMGPAGCVNLLVPRPPALEPPAVDGAVVPPSLTP